jgi:hypothetical protein
MTIIIDECLPKRLIGLFVSHTVWTVPQIDLAGSNDQTLLSELDQKEVDVFITIDGNMEYQQQFKNRKFGTIVIRSVSNRFADLANLKDDLLAAVETIQPGDILHLPR